MELTPSALVLIGLLLAAWTFGAVWVVLSAQKRALKARAAHSAAKRLSRMIDESPAIPMLVRGDGKIEGPHRLAGWLGLSRMPGYLSELEAGEVGLTRAIGNILDNSIAAVPQGEGRILVMLARRKNSVRIVVSDNGAGMLPGELARALDGYVLEGDGSGKEKRGLGLPLARQLIEAHGGRLNIQSEKGAGATATITLP